MNVLMIIRFDLQAEYFLTFEIYMEKKRGKFVSHILYTLLYNTQHFMKQICEAASLLHFKDPQVHGIVVKSVQG